MAHGPEQHIEHAEHAQHAAHDPFDKRVTVSIAVVAAMLAAVTMMGHRAHNDTLRLQGEALQFQTDVGIYNTKTSNQYAFYQAKKNRGVMYEAFLDFVAMMNLKVGTEKVQEKATGKWETQVDEYSKELPKMLQEADKLKEETKELQEKANHALAQSHEVHKRADRFDFGELGLQLGVVLCSLAILKKSRGFWYGGLACSVAGLLVALSGVLGLFIGGSNH
jgi:hypothetical protein